MVGLVIVIAPVRKAYSDQSILRTQIDGVNDLCNAQSHVGNVGYVFCAPGFRGLYENITLPA